MMVNNGNVFKITEPAGGVVPIVVSVPHCGVEFPEEIQDEYKPSLKNQPDDTDWFVDRLYDFAPSMGMTLISAVNSRWVIDLNRDPDSKPLYTDGRIITALCPSTTFLGERLYIDNRNEVEPKEVSRRLEQYYRPYHTEINNRLASLRSRFGKVLLWDCHSIRQHVKTIQADAFPDLILGDVDEQSAAQKYIVTTLQTLRSDRYTVSHNHPFKGGTITRSFGKPDIQVHALQLEMCKVHYMDDTEKKYDEGRANKMRTLLQRTFDNLIQALGS